MKKIPVLIIISIMVIQCCGLRHSIDKLLTPPQAEDEPGNITSTAPEKASPTPTASHTPHSTDTLTPTPDFSPTPTTTKAIPHPATLTITDVVMIDPQSGWALALMAHGGSQLLRTEDGGETWQTVFELPENLAAAGATSFVGSFPNSRTAWLTPHGEDFVPTDTVVFITSDGGASWRTSQLLPTYGAGDQFNVFLKGLDHQQAWLLTQVTVLGTGVNHSQRLFHTVDGGQYWEETVLILNGINGMDFLNEDFGILASELEGPYEAPVPAITYLTHDGGQSWEEFNLPNPAVPSTAPFFHCRAQFPELFDSLNAGLMVTCYEDWSESVSNPFYYSSDNGGAAWLIHELPGTQTIWMFDQNSGWTYGPLADLYQSRDGGSNWEPVAFVFPGEIQSISFSDEEHGWLVANTVINGSSLYRTVDGGGTWEALAWND